MTTKTSRKRKKAKRAPLKIDPRRAPPALVCAIADGVEQYAHAHALGSGHAFAGYVPATLSPAAGTVPTTTSYPLQALKWNVRASEASLIITADAVLFGRALAAREYAQRWSKPWLQVWPADFDAARLRRWLQTHAIRVLHVTGPASYQAPTIESFVDTVMAQVWVAG